METFIDMHRKCIQQVVAYDYFQYTFEMVVRENGFKSVEQFAESTDKEEIVSTWNNFWFALPDSSAIQRKPFNLMCDICEGVYHD